MSEARSGLDSINTAELVAALSLATDLGTGFPLEHALRSCLLATWTAQALELGDDEIRNVYYVSLLKYLGCTVTSHVSAQVLGDELGMGTWFATVDLGNQDEVMAAFGENVGAGRPDAERRALLSRLMSSPTLFTDNMAQHCELGHLLAVELGLAATVSQALAQAFSRWDGTGTPMVAGDAIALSIRIAVLTEEAERYSRVRGPEAAVRMVQARAGHSYDPDIAEVFAGPGADMLKKLDAIDCWVEVLAAEPDPRGRLHGDEVDRALLAVADFTDMKSPYLLGHCRAVANTAAEAAAASGLPASDVLAVRRAAWVHDLGRVAVSSAIWAKPGPLPEGEWERVRLHSHYTDRVLSRSEALAGLRTTAALHHERIDGSGYHRGAPAASQSPIARLLAAADVYTALTEERPYRQAFAPERAAKILRDEATAGRLDGAATSAVLAASGQGRRGGRPLVPANLTAREVEVLRGLARGQTTKELAERLFISAKTADNHVQHIYEKLQVSTRAGATLFALSHGLLD
jgi:HD-GYP domain-containing protein (c-di-GMP phosphodiesterase class II)